MYTSFGNSNVELCKEGKTDTPKIGSWKKKFLSSDLRISNNILQIGDRKFKLMHTLSESKSMFARE